MFLNALVARSTGQYALLLLGVSLTTACGGGGKQTEATEQPLSTYTVTVAAGTGGNSNVSTVAVTQGATTAITFTAMTGYSLASATGCNGNLTGNQYTTGAITANCTVTASFTRNNYTVSATASTGGSVSQATTRVEHGATTTLTLLPQNGYQLANVSGCNGSLNGNQYTTGAVTADCAILANFNRTVSQTISGKVIDGYVRGATVWLDINGNKIKDSDEPFALSKQAGDYLLELTAVQAECAPYSTMYVDVPVGAIDEDSGPVTAAYQMSRPAYLKPLSNEDVLHVSPLTTLLQDQIMQKLQLQTTGADSCAVLKANQSLRQNLLTELQNLVTDIVQKHNISAQRIFADFIQSNDKTSYQLAQSIVKGLQASFAYREVLKQKYPTALFIRSLFYQGSSMDNNGAYPNAWYRDSAVWLPNGYVAELVKMQDDLINVVRPVYLREQQEKSWSNATYIFKQDIFNYLGDNNTSFRCAAEESIKLKSLTGVTFTFSNSTEAASVKDPATCVAASFQQTQWRYYTADYLRGGIQYHTMFSISPADPEFAQLKDWVDLKDKADQLKLLELYERLAKSGYLFDEQPTIAVSNWHKRSTDDRSKNRIQIDRYSDGRWVKQTTQDDQTIVKQCSKDGLSWGSCN